MTKQELNRQRYASNPEKYRAKQRRYHVTNRESLNAKKRAHNKSHPVDTRIVVARNRLHRTGWTPEEYQAAFEAQGGCCATCGTHQDDLPYALNADHCHATKRKRGLLCRRCNRVLGFVQDSVSLLTDLAMYLTYK